jgi:phenylacetate-CoA ligase
MTSKARELGIRLEEIGIRKVFLGGEPWSDTYQRRMEKEWGIQFCDLYGLIEVGHPFGECAEKNGMHCLDDLFITEIIDPDTGKAIPCGELGEIVLTPLWREAMPLIRYRTGDVAKLLEYKACHCGRTFPKISRIKARTAHLIKVGKAKIFPIDVEEVLHAAPELSGEYQIILSKPAIQDILEVKAECNPGVEETSPLRAKLEAQLEKATGAKARVEFVPFGQFPRKTTAKAQRIVKRY